MHKWTLNAMGNYKGVSTIDTTGVPQKYIHYLFKLATKNLRIILELITLNAYHKTKLSIVCNFRPKTKTYIENSEPQF